MYLEIKSMMKPKNGNTFYQKILKIGLMKYWATQQQILMGHRYPPVTEQSMTDLFTNSLGW